MNVIPRHTNFSRLLLRRNLLLGAALSLALSVITFAGPTAHAATAAGAGFSLTPTSGSYASGSTMTVTIRENGGGLAINTVEPVVSYPAGQLQYVSATPGDAFTETARAKNTAGTLDAIFYRPGGQPGVSGDNAVATLSFKVIGTSGPIALAFTSASAMYDSSGTGRNVIQPDASVGASYTANGVAQSGGAAGGSSAPPAASASALTITPDGSGGQVSQNVAGTPDMQISGKVLLTPAADASSPGQNSVDGITKIEYYLDNKLVDTETSAPYTYHLDTKKLRNGSHNVTVKTFYRSGRVDTESQTVTVKNPVTVQSLLSAYRSLTLAVIILLLIAGFVFWRLLWPRLRNQPGPAGGSSAGAPVGLPSDPAVVPSPAAPGNTASPTFSPAFVPPSLASRPTGETVSQTQTPAAVITPSPPSYQTPNQPELVQPQPSAAGSVVKPTEPVPVRPPDQPPSQP